MTRNSGNTLRCPYGDDAGCLALLNATFGGPAEGRIQQGEVSEYWMFKIVESPRVRHSGEPRIGVRGRNWSP